MIESHASTKSFIAVFLLTLFCVMPLAAQVPAKPLKKPDLPSFQAREKPVKTTPVSRRVSTVGKARKYRTGLILETPEQMAMIPDYVYDGPTLAAALPDSVNNSDGLPPVRSQGEQGSCAAWAVGYYSKTYQEGREHGWDVSSAANQFSPAFVYNHNNEGLDEGSQVLGNMLFLAEQGCATWEEMPYNVEDYLTWPDPEIYRNALTYRADSTYKIYNDEQMLEDSHIQTMQQILADGNVLVISIPYYASFDDVGTEGIYYGPEQGEEENGSHAMCVVGYDNSIGGGALLIVNSWGTDWGNEGFFWLTYDFIKTYCDRAFVMEDKIDYTPEIFARVTVEDAWCGSLNGTIYAIDSYNDFGTHGFFRNYGGPRTSFDWYVDLTDLADYLPPDAGHKFIFRIEDGLDDGYAATFTEFSFEYGGTTYRTDEIGVSGEDFGISQVVIEGGEVANSPLGGYLAGNIPGRFGPYYVFEDLEVYTDDTLIIGAGAVLEFAGSVSLLCFGVLEAQGTETDSIRFLSASSDPFPGIWDYIFVRDNHITLSYCDIRHAQYGVYLRQTDSRSTITDCSISECESYCAILYESQAVVERNLLTNSIYGIYATNSSSGTFRNNIITGHYNAGIQVENSTALVENNTVVLNKQGDNTAGVWLVNAENTVLRNNIIGYNDIGISNESSSGTALYYNDLWENKMGLIFEYEYNYYLIEPGATDMSFDPQFVDIDNGDFHLAAGSPAIDAGDPESDYSNEPLSNGERINLGAYGNTGEATASISYAEIALSDTAVVVGDVDVGGSGSGTFTIVNEGSEDLVISSIGSNSDVFTVSPDSATVAPDGSLVVTITFSPVASGDQSATITIINNDSDEGTLTVSAGGNGVSLAVPEIVLSDSLIDIGDIQVDSTGTGSFAISNSGTADLVVSSISSDNDVFAVSPDSATVSPGDTQLVTVTFSPAESGEQSATITITSNDSDEGTLTLTVAGSGGGDLIDVLAYMPFNIGDVFTYDDGFKTEITRTVELDWLGNRTAYEMAWTVSPDPQLTDFGYYFITSGDSLFWASVHFTHDNIADYVKLDPPALMGTANTIPGDTINTLRITNYGVDEDTGLPLVEDDSSIVQVVVNRSDSVSVPYGTFEDCITMTVFLKCSDEEDGSEFLNVILAKGMGIIQFIANDLDTVLSLTDYQQGVTPVDAPEISLSITSIEMGEVILGSQGTASFSITNSGNAPLAIDSITSNNEVFTVSPDSATVSPGDTQLVTVTFSPAESGEQSAVITITSNDSDEGTLTVSAGGNGVSRPVPEIVLSDSLIDIGDIQVDSTGTGSLIITNTGTADLIVSDISSNNEVFAVSPDSATISPGDTQLVTISFSPADSGAQSAAITIACNDSDEEIVILQVVGNGFITETEPTAPVCDFNGDSRINIADVITLLIFQRNNPGDPGGDFNNDGTSDINDAIAMILAQRGGTCPDEMTFLAAAGDEIPVSRMEGLTAGDVAYLENIMSQMNLSVEEEKKFRLALYGDTGPASLPKAFSLAQNVPNPFNPSTTIKFDVPEGTPVTVSLKVYDIRGRLVNTLVNDIRQSGTYSVFWDGTDDLGRQVPSGVYFYRMQAGDFMQTRKMVLLK
jgi:plastocyanin